MHINAKGNQVKAMPHGRCGENKRLKHLGQMSLLCKSSRREYSVNLWQYTE